MTKWFDKYNDADKDLCSIPLRLQNLAKTFSVTGNVTISDELYMIANMIEFCREDMRNAISQSIDETYKTSQKLSDTLLKTILVKNVE